MDRESIRLSFRKQELEENINKFTNEINYLKTNTSQKNNQILIIKDKLSSSALQVRNLEGEIFNLKTDLEGKNYKYENFIAEFNQTNGKIQALTAMYKSTENEINNSLKRCKLSDKKSLMQEGRGPELERRAIDEKRQIKLLESQINNKKLEIQLFSGLILNLRKEIEKKQQALNVLTANFNEFKGEMQSLIDRSADENRKTVEIQMSLASLESELTHIKASIDNQSIRDTNNMNYRRSL